MDGASIERVRRALEGSLSREEAIAHCRALLADREEALALLRRLEWCAGEPHFVCPGCGAARAYQGTFTSPPSHQPGCELAAFLGTGS